MSNTQRHGVMEIITRELTDAIKRAVARFKTEHHLDGLTPAELWLNPLTAGIYGLVEGQVYQGLTVGLNPELPPGRARVTTVPLQFEEEWAVTRRAIEADIKNSISRSFDLVT